ncbi:uncharacterized protein LOC124924540 [Impatiens glandulifera]|uniref:uncharacterized protein LOC124924540 n=1 Tax=Impatiens glandulifera TaxID=253017 RepID=UPI001FB11BB4|nr:uncharacterized protein LOC124924540 [Impatiens glandulifera]
MSCSYVKEILDKLTQIYGRNVRIKKYQKVFMCIVNKSKWADNDSEESPVERETDVERETNVVTCLMADDQSKFAKDKVCPACQLGKHGRSSFKNKGKSQFSRCLELLHMDLFGPIPVKSLGGMIFALIIIDDFSRFTWVAFLPSKDKTVD